MDTIDASTRTTSHNALRLLEQCMYAKVAECGPQSLSEIELISIVLRPARTTRLHERAADLLVRFGSLRSLLTADRAAVLSAGLTEKEYATLHAAVELARRHYQQLMMTGSALTNPRATREFLRMRLRDLPHEVFAVVYLDNRHRVIGFEELFRGTIDGASVHPREVVKQALARNAAV